MAPLDGRVALRNYDVRRRAFGKPTAEGTPWASAFSGGLETGGHPIRSPITQPAVRHGARGRSPFPP
jgi:hypothetical protein